VAGSKGTTGTDATEPRPAPFAFRAITAHLYVRPLVTPVTVSGERGPALLAGFPPFVDEHVVV